MCNEFLQRPDFDLFNDSDANSMHPRELFVFLHIPKTAGSSAQRDLKTAFGNNRHISSRDLNNEWQQFLNDSAENDFHHVRGHLQHQHLLDLAARKIDYRAGTYLRHPIERLQSHFTWIHTSIRPGFLKSKPPKRFESFVSRQPGDYFCRRLVGEAASPEEAIEKIESQFWFVGISEYYHLCQALLMKLLGSEYSIQPRTNVTPPTDQVDTSINDALRAQLQERFAVDLAVYQHFRSRWDNRLNDIVEKLFAARSVSANEEQASTIKSAA